MIDSSSSNDNFGRRLSMLRAPAGFGHGQCACAPGGPSFYEI